MTTIIIGTYAHNEPGYGMIFSNIADAIEFHNEVFGMDIPPNTTADHLEGLLFEEIYGAKSGGGAVEIINGKSDGRTRGYRGITLYDHR